MNAREVPHVLALLHGVRPARPGWLAQCPAHEDRSPSLSVLASTSGRIVLHCFAGCTTVDVVAALGLTMRDLSADPGRLSPRVAHGVAQLALGEAHDVVVSRDQRHDAGEVAAMRQTVSEAANLLADAGENGAAATYLRGRFGIGLDAAVRMGLGYSATLGGGGRVVVPFANPSGTVGGYQARAIGEAARVRWLSPRGTWARCGWFARGRDTAPANDAVVVCEGPGDALSAAGLGFDAIAVRGAGLAADVRVQDTVRRWTAQRPVLLAGDGDDAGRRFTSTLLAALADHDAPVVPLRMPDGTDLAALRERDHDRAARWLHRALESAAVLA